MISTINEAIERIKAATPNSPILVRHTKSPPWLETSFAATVRGRILQKEQSWRYIGCYHQNMDVQSIRREIRDAIELAT